MTFPRITKVTPQVFMHSYEDEDGKIFDVVSSALIWLEVKGAVYARQLRRGEDLEAVVASYRKGGFIDDDCCFYDVRQGE
jgi:hypothetical protein